MATSHTDYLPGLVAGASMVTSQYLMVVPNGTTADSVVVNSTQGAAILGVLYNKPAAGQAAQVAVGPRVKVTLNATLAAGVEFVSDNTGKAIAGTTGNLYAGKLLEGGVAGDVVSCQFYQGAGRAHP
jgi:hypothetical protein